LEAPERVVLRKRRIRLTIKKRGGVEPREKKRSAGGKHSHQKKKNEKHLYRLSAKVSEGARDRKAKNWLSQGEEREDE